MRLEDLRVFCILARSNSIHRAAQLSGLTQSAVTKILQRLEAEFGIGLADRSGRGVALTPAGHTFLEKAEGLRSLVADIYVEMQAARSDAAGQIRVGTVTPILNSLLVPLVAKSLRKNPSLSFNISAQVTALLIEEVIDGGIDFALIYTHKNLPEDLNSDFLAKQEFCIVGRKGNPLFGNQSSSNDLRNANWLLPQSPNAAREIVFDYYSEHGLPAPKIAVECNTSASSLIYLVSQSDLLTVVTPQTLTTQAAEDLAVLPMPGFDLSNSLRLVYRRASSMSPAAQSFRSMLIEATENLRTDNTPHSWQ